VIPSGSDFSAKRASRPAGATWAAALLLCALAWGSALAVNAQSGQPRTVIAGIDHIPIVVNNLDQAQADFRAMGFAIKPGRFHADGIRNAHVKFPDGSEVELITASKAVDALTAEYTAKLKSSEGPVYFGLFAPDFPEISARIHALPVKPQEESGMFTFPPDSPLHPLFIGHRNKAANDKPEYFEHRNGAVRLSALWVRDSPELREELQGLGVPLRPIDLCGFGGAAKGIRAELPEGDLFLMSSNVTVVAARVEVRRLDDTANVLRSNGIPTNMGKYCDEKSVWVPPFSAHGIWIEFTSRDSIASRTNSLTSSD